VSDARSAPKAHGVVGRALLLAALLLIIGAILFFGGLFPIPERSRIIIAAVLAVTAIVDAVLGVFFLRRGQT
jgi:hypothetical protein